MSAIDRTFADLARAGRKAFIAYITAGDPDLAATARLVPALELAGVDIVELGVPFSDPIADGPVNQEAAIRALDSGTTLAGMFDTVRTIRETSRIPIVLFCYYNTVLQHGLEKFAGDCADAGIDGVLALDLPPEEAADYKKLLDDRDIATIFLISPVTPDERIETIAKWATGFVYCVAQMGVTGVRDQVAGVIPELVARIRRHTDLPVAVGFGISTPPQVAEAAREADGVIVGSAIVRMIADKGGEPGFERAVAAFAGTLTEPLKGP